jgi:hypothetical protein
VGVSPSPPHSGIIIAFIAVFLVGIGIIAVFLVGIGIGVILSKTKQSTTLLANTNYAKISFPNGKE